MASVTTAPGVPAIIQQKIRSLRMKLTGWIIVDGIAWLLMFALIVAALDMGIDRLFKMDFSQRLIMLCLMVIGLGVVFYYRFIRPFAKLPTDDALILEVENQNQELKESLISSVQLSRTGEVEEKGMSVSLWEATIQQGIDQAKAVNFSSALNQARSAVNWLVLVIAIVGMIAIGVGVTQGGFLGTWFNRNILLGNDQWPQNTYLQFIDPKTEEVVTSNTIVVARGDDVKQIVRVDTERSKVTDVAITLEIDDGNNRSKVKLRNSGRKNDFDHVTVFRNISAEFRMRAVGGDEITEWVQVKLVEAPTIDNLELTANLPAYVGSNNVMNLEGSGPHTILKGSTISLKAKVNKSLQSATLKLGEKRIPLKKTSDDRVYELNLPESGELQGGKYEFELVDVDGQMSNRPITFTLKISEDKPPTVRASLQGISGLVIPRAYLPISFSASDQFGLTKAAFYYSYKAGDSSVPVEKTIEIPLEKENPEDSTVRQKAILDLRPENIPVGVTLRVHVLAWDNQPGEAEPGKSREFLLRVVSEDELRADLLRREVEQRNAFEQAYNNQLELQAELRAMAAANPLKADTKAEQDKIIEEFFMKRENNVLASQRRQKIIGTNIAAVADRFESFLVEAENNRLDESEKNLKPDEDDDDTRTYKERVSSDIVNPIRSLDENEIVAAAQSIGECRRRARKATFGEQVENTAKIQETILAKMSQILEKMEEAESFQQVVNGYVKIKKDEQRLAKKAEEEKKKPGELDDIFDENDDSGGSDKDKKKKK